MKLNAKDKCLNAGEHILLRMYAAGDCDSIGWPFSRSPSQLARQKGNLAMALFDARECGLVPNESVVELPNGEPFDFDAELAIYEAANPPQPYEY